ncbi:hypothetical protein PAP_02440 [Palaeococcus pacificus DY20341]|uniref:Uncharacterized protein n=1 Tax=Palaeococcus pacificus DY20341 TaxID=1343739 RepID=A0A075LWK9_9EURY|nr:hypothetical protein PAP_02440 [Palaeococcus pacificus DY20341]
MFDVKSLKFWKKVSKDESEVVRAYAQKDALQFRRMM